MTSDQPIQSPLLPSEYDCGAASGWDMEFGRTHYCALEPNHETDHYFIQKPEYIRHRVFGSEPVAPRARRLS